MDCFICHRSNWMQEKCLGFLRNLLENYKDMIEDADVFLPLECPGADELLVRLVREEIPQDVIERMSERSRRGFLLELDDDPVHTTLGGLWNAADTRPRSETSFLRCSAMRWHRPGGRRQKRTSSTTG